MVKASKWFRKLLMIRSGPAEPKSAPSSSSSSSSRDYAQPSHSYAKRKEKEKHSMRWNVGRGRAILHGSDDDDDDDKEAAEVVQVQQNRVENRQAGVAMAVAAATVAAADAAVSAAQAAAKLVHLSSINGHFFIFDGGSISREQWAAIRIQSAFRGYLSQRAIRALKGVVKLQALVRGQMVRRQATITLRCMQSLLRVQAKVQAQRNTLLKCAHQYETNNYKQARPLEEERKKVVTSIEDLERKGAHNIYQKANAMASPGFPFPHQLERSVDNGDVEKGRSWLDHRWIFATRTLGNPIFDSNSTDRRDDGAKIVEMDTAKVVKKKRNDSMSEPCSPFSPSNISSSPSSTMGSPNNNNKNNNNIPTILNKPFMGEEEGGRRRRLRHLRGVDEDYYPREIFHSSNNSNNNNHTNNNHNHNSSSINSSSSIIISNIGTPLPNYMTTTHSSKAKLRSLSEPKQRPDSQLVSLRTRHSLMAHNEKEPPKQRPIFSSLVNSKGGDMHGPISVDHNSTTSFKERHYSRH